jgi:hypothetical protein
MRRDLYIHFFAATAQQHNMPAIPLLLQIPQHRRHSEHDLVDWNTWKHRSLNSRIPCHAKIASRAHIRALYESSETHASTIRTYSMTFLGFGREKEREGRAQTWVKPVNGLEKRRRRRCVMKNEEDREKDGYLYTLPTHTRSSIPRTHIHATEHVAVCSIFRMFATWRSKHILLNNARLQFSWVLVPSILILSTLHHLLPNSFQITLKDIQYHFFLFETTAQERQRRGDMAHLSSGFSHLLIGGLWLYL